MKKMLDLIEANALTNITAYLLEEIRKLARAGADFGLMASNTPHVVFDALLTANDDTTDQHCGGNLSGR